MIDRIRYYLSLVNTRVASACLMDPGQAPDSASDSLRAAIDWLCHAQDATDDRGVARSYSLAYLPYLKRRGWTASYPETTGYIIPTVFDYAKQTRNDLLFARAAQMADWECDVQMPDGAVQGGTIADAPSPAVFNTGQVIFGWVRAYQETGVERYILSALKAGEFLVSGQDEDGAWRRNLSKFASPRMPSYTYNTRTAWALYVLGEQTGEQKYIDAAVRNIDFALTEQLPNGWFNNNCLNDPDRPLLHTIAYALRGILEVAIRADNSHHVSLVQRAADQLLARQRPDGSLAGRFNNRWEPAAKYSCLTGNAQIGIVWGRLYQVTGDERYLAGLSKANGYLRRIQWRGTGNPGLDGGISGSHPLHGEYGRFEVLNWAVKFFADSLMLEAALRESETG